MKIRIQRSNAGRDWHDGFDAEVTERGAQAIRVKVPGSFGYIETFWAVGKKAGEQWNNSRSLRVHPDDVPALASLPVRVAKTKPVDLNAHPMADVLREVVRVADRHEAVSAGEAIDEICAEVDCVVDAAEDAAGHMRGDALRAIAAAAVVALSQKGGT